MIKKSDLRSEFERIVKSSRIKTLRGYKPCTHWKLKIIQRSFSRPYIALFGYWSDAEDSCMGCAARSYPFNSYKSAYQTLVRL